jgi:prepilin peptidase CpaA
MPVGQDLASLITPAALLLAMAVAVRQDLVQHRISNVLTFGTFSAGLVTHWTLSGPGGLAFALAGGAVGLACLLPLYLARGMGAGDVKLMAAAGAFLGPFGALVASVTTLVFGAVLAMAIVAARAMGSRTATTAQSPAPDGTGESGDTMAQVRKERFPYAAAIGLGVAVALWQA